MNENPDDSDPSRKVKIKKDREDKKPDEWTNTDIINERKIGGETKHKERTFKDSIFDDLNENPHLSLRELNSKYPENNKATIRSYFHEWHDINPNVKADADYSPLFQKKVTSARQFSHDYHKYPMGKDYVNKQVYMREVDGGKRILVFSDDKGKNQIAEFEKRKSDRDNIANPEIDTIKIGKNIVSKEEFEKEARTETTQELAKRYDVSKFEVCRIRDILEIGNASKFEFMKHDANGNPLTKEQQLDEATKYFKEKILTEQFKKEHGLGEGEATTRDMLKKSNHSGFYYACWKLGIRYNDVLHKLNLDINKDLRKWEKMRYDEQDNRRPKSEIVDLLANYVAQVILDDDFKKKYNLKDNQAPTADILRKEGHDDLISFMSSVGIKYNEVMRKASMELNKDNEKWRPFRVEGDGNPLDQDKKIQAFQEYFEENVNTAQLREKYGLEKGEAPTQAMLTNEKHSDFLHALGRENILYNDLVEKSGLTPHEIEENKKIGIDMHSIIECKLLEHASKKGCMAFSEISVTKNNNYTHCDIVLLVDKQASTLSPEIQQLYDINKVKIIAIDFTLGDSQSNKMDHVLRDYQSDNRMLIIVPTHSIGEQDPPVNTPFRQSVKIMGPERFAEFIGLHGEAQREFMEKIKLAKDATWKEGDYKEILEDEAKRSKEIISDQFPQTTKDFRKIIENNPEYPKDLLDVKISKSTLDYYREKEGELKSKDDEPMKQNMEHLLDASFEKGRDERSADKSIPDHLDEKLINSKIDYGDTKPKSEEAPETKNDDNERNETNDDDVKEKIPDSKDAIQK